MSFPYDFLSLGQWGMSASSWALFCLAVFVVGLSKTGIPGATILAVPLMAMVIPAKASVGVLLPIYMLADLISLRIWWRYARWNCCFPYLVFVGIGVWSASLVAGAVDDKTFGVVIGWTVLAMIGFALAAEVARKRGGGGDLPDSTPSEKPPLARSALFGVSAGLFSALANAAGPIVSLYMIASRLDKYAFLGTSAVCAFVMNWIKVPLFVSLGMIRPDTLKLDVVAIPMVVLGGFAGVLLARKLPQKAFKNAVLALAFLASVKLILS